MQSRLMIIMAAICLGVLSQTQAHAQAGKLLREGIEAAGKKVFGRTVQKATQEGSEQILKKAATTAIREAGQESAEAFAKRAGIAVLRHSDDAVKAVGMHGSAIAAPLINEFGDGAAKALTKLSSSNARRMAIMSDVFKASGRGTDWMKLLADKGDLAAEWLWKNKGTALLATTATAFLANPDPFLHAGEKIASASIETAGAHVARPMIEQTVSGVAPQVAKQVTRAIVAPAGSVVNATTQDPTVFVIVALLIAATAIAIYRKLVRLWAKGTPQL